MRVQIDMTSPRVLPEDVERGDDREFSGNRGPSWMTQWTKYFSRFERLRQGGFTCKEPMQKIPPDKNCRFCGLMRRIHTDETTAA